MAKDGKKAIRAKFRDACFKRDKYSCVTCGMKSKPEKAQDELDAHHITNREAMPNGGYVKENGISLCSECHINAERFYSEGEAPRGFHPDDLYKLIGSSKQSAEEAIKRLA